MASKDTACTEEQCHQDQGESNCGCKVGRDSLLSKNSNPNVKEDQDKDDRAVKHDEEILQSVFSGSRTNEMVFIPGGMFKMGTDQPVFVADGEMPARQVKIKSFYLDKYEVSNQEFEIFVKANNYKTEVFQILLLEYFVL